MVACRSVGRPRRGFRVLVSLVVAFILFRDLLIGDLALREPMTDTVAKAALAVKPRDTAGGTDGGWIHSTPLKSRYQSPTGLSSFDGESAWRQYDPHIVVPKEWGKQAEHFQNSLRNWPEPTWAHTEGAKATWKSANTKRWPLHRSPKYGRVGIECNL